MVLVFPFELTFDSELNFKAASSQRLGVCVNLDSGDMMDEFVEDFTEFGEFS